MDVWKTYIKRFCKSLETSLEAAGKVTQPIAKLKQQLLFLLETTMNNIGDTDPKGRYLVEQMQTVFFQILVKMAPFNDVASLQSESGFVQGDVFYAQLLDKHINELRFLLLSKCGAEIPITDKKYAHMINSPFERKYVEGDVNVGEFFKVVAVNVSEDDFIVSFNPAFLHQGDATKLGPIPKEECDIFLRLQNSSKDIVLKEEPTSQSESPKTIPSPNLEPEPEKKSAFEESNNLCIEAESYLKKKEYAHAFEACTRSIRLNRKNSKAYELRGEVARLVTNNRCSLLLKQAALDYHRAIELYAESEIAKQGYASLFVQSAKKNIKHKRYEEANKYLEEASKLHESKEIVLLQTSTKKSENRKKRKKSSTKSTKKQTG